MWIEAREAIYLCHTNRPLERMVERCFVDDGCGMRWIPIENEIILVPVSITSDDYPVTESNMRVIGYTRQGMITSQRII